MSAPNDDTRVYVLVQFRELRPSAGAGDYAFLMCAPESHRTRLDHVEQFSDSVEAAERRLSAVQEKVGAEGADTATKYTYGQLNV